MGGEGGGWEKSAGRRRGGGGEKRQEGELLVKEAKQLMRRKEGGQLLSRKAEQVRRRGSEEDLDWVRRRMQEVNLSRPDETSRPRVDPETHGFVPHKTMERSGQHPEPSRRFEGGRKV